MLSLSEFALDAPIEELRALHKRGEWDSIAPLPPGYLDWDMDQNTPWHSLTVLEHTLEALTNLRKVAKQFGESKEDSALMAIAILLHDTGKLNPKCHGHKNDHKGPRTTYIGHEKYSLKATQHIMSHAGFSQLDIDRVKNMIEGSSRVNPNYVPSSETCNLKRKALCRFVFLTKDDWKRAILVNIGDATGKHKDLFDSYDFTYHFSMMKKIQALNPKKIMDTVPLLEYDEVYKILKDHDLVEKAIAKMLLWQFKNPKVNKKDAVGFVRSFLHGR